MAASSLCRFSNGAVGNLTVNYLNPPKIGFHGNDQLRLFGTKGILEAVDGLSRVRMAKGDGPLEDLETPKDRPRYFELLLDQLIDGKEMPLTLERELQSTRVVIAMKEAAETGRTVSVPAP